MELKKRVDLRRVLIILYILFFVIYIIIGLQPAKATSYEISTEIFIPRINLTSDVTDLALKNHALETPETIVGSFSRAKNKTLLIGHSSSVFKNLNQLSVGDKIIYDLDGYEIIEKKIIPKDKIKMDELLKAEKIGTLVLMTCAGEDLGDGDATERLIITATKTYFRLPG